MSTHSLIVRLSPEGFYEARYHHVDGNPGVIGKTLLNTFNTEERLDRLFSVPYDFHTINRDIDAPLRTTNPDVVKMYDKQIVFDKIELLYSPEKDKKNFFTNLEAQEYLYFFEPTKKEWLMAQNRISMSEWGWMPLKAAEKIDDLFRKILNPENFTRAIYEQLNAIEYSVQNNLSWDYFVQQEKENSPSYTKLCKFYLEERLQKIAPEHIINASKLRI